MVSPVRAVAQAASERAQADRELRAAYEQASLTNELMASLTGVIVEVRGGEGRWIAIPYDPTGWHYSTNDYGTAYEQRVCGLLHQGLW